MRKVTFSHLSDVCRMKRPRHGAEHGNYHKMRERHAWKVSHLDERITFTSTDISANV